MQFFLVLGRNIFGREPSLNGSLCLLYDWNMCFFSILFFFLQKQGSLGLCFLDKPEIIIIIILIIYYNCLKSCKHIPTWSRIVNKKELL